MQILYNTLYYILFLPFKRNFKSLSAIKREEKRCAKCRKEMEKWCFFYFSLKNLAYVKKKLYLCGGHRFLHINSCARHESG